MQSLTRTPRERLNEGHCVPLQAPPQTIQQDHRTSHARPPAGAHPPPSPLSRPGDESVAGHIRKDGTQRRNTDEDANEPRRACESRCHPGSILGCRALQHLHGLPVQEASTVTGDHHRDKKYPIGQVRPANQSEGAFLTTVIASPAASKDRPENRVASRRVILGASTIGRANGIIAMPAGNG
jgi:hypothetical protein